MYGLVAYIKVLFIRLSCNNQNFEVVPKPFLTVSLCPFTLNNGQDPTFVTFQTNRQILWNLPEAMTDYELLKHQAQPVEIFLSISSLHSIWNPDAEEGKCQSRMMSYLYYDDEYLEQQPGDCMAWAGMG
jgi:hypothetical protein